MWPVISFQISLVDWMISLIACILNIGECLHYHVFVFQKEHFACLCILRWTGLHKDHSNSFLHGNNIIWWVTLLHYGRAQCDTNNKSAITVVSRCYDAWYFKMLLNMISAQYPNYCKAEEVDTGYFDSLDILILFSYLSSIVIMRDYCIVGKNHSTVSILLEYLP